MTPEAEPLADWLRPDLVTAGLVAGDRDGALAALAELLARGDSAVRPEEAFAALAERERLGSTGIGDGCALPHARLEHLREPLLAVARAETPVEFGASDGRPVSLFFALAVPASRTAIHLRILASVARWLQHGSRRTELLAAPDRASMMAILGGA